MLSNNQKIRHKYYMWVRHPKGVRQNNSAESNQKLPYPVDVVHELSYSEDYRNTTNTITGTFIP